MARASTPSFGLLLIAVISLYTDLRAVAQEPKDLAWQHAALEKVVLFLDAADPDSGLKVVDQLLQDLDEAADPEVLYYLRSFRAEQLYYHGLFDEAMSDAMGAERLAHKLDDSLLVANSLNLQGLIHENIGDHHGALPYLRSSLAWYPARAASRYSVTLPHHIHGNLGQSLTATGSYDSARYHLERSRKLATEAKVPRGIAIADWALGKLYQQEGLPDRAIPLLQRSMSLAEETDQTDIVLENHIALAEAFYAQGRRDRMLEELERGSAYEREHSITAVSKRDFYKRSARLLSLSGHPAVALEHGTVANLLDSTINARNRQVILGTVRELMDRENELEVQKLQASLYAEALERTRFSRLVVAVGSAVAILVLLGLYLGYRSRQRHLGRMAELELLRAQQEATIAELRIREQVGRDMHDDLGAGLSGLKLKSELALRTETDPDRRTQLREIADRSGELITSMRQIIWAMNKDQASLADLVAYASSYARSYLAEHGLKVQVEESTQWPDIQLTPDQRRNLFLVVKECLHNVVKHAHATSVQLRFEWKDGELSMSLSDDGIGFDPAKNGRRGNGLRNMQERMNALNGSLRMEHERGTRILCSVPLANKRSIAKTANGLQFRAHERP